MREYSNSSNAEALSVFLLPQSDGQWTACIASEKPDPQAIKLCDEQSYPVSYFYRRYDANGSDVYEADICNNREELLTSLNWSGKCGHTIINLWDFNFDENRDPAIADLFRNSYNALMENIRADGPYDEADIDPVAIAYEAIEVLDSILSKPNGEELFQLANIAYNLSDVANETDLPLLARKTLDACLNSSVPILTGERVDAVRSLLEFGMEGNRSPEFPSATPEQMLEVLLSCNLDIFTEIVDSVAVDNQSFYAPDNDFSLDAQKTRASAVAFIEDSVNKKLSLENRIHDANLRLSNAGEKESAPDRDLQSR